MGGARHGVDFQNNQLATSLAMQGTTRSQPASATRRYPGMPPEQSLEVALPDGRTALVRRVEVRTLGRTRRTYVVAIAGDDGLPSTSSDLAKALTRAAGGGADRSWAERKAAELADKPG